MNIVVNQVGVDVSMGHLDFSINGGKPWRVPNDLAGVNLAISRIPLECVVHMESTGGYERLLRRELTKAGFEVRTHNPRKVRRLADARGVTAKTDALDARHLADSGSLLKPGAPKSAEREACCDISRAIAAIKDDIADHKKRLRMPELNIAAQQAYKSVILHLEKTVKQLEKEFVRALTETSMNQRYKIALSVRGVGPALARVAICELPEDLSWVNRRTSASFAGLAPINNDSGKFEGRAQIGRGNVHLKAALYMPAMALVSRPGWARDHYSRLRAAGRCHQQAAVAIMRRLLVLLVAVLKRGTPWEGVPPQRT